MTGKELLGHLDGMILCIDIGAGDTVFSGCGIDNEYQLDFNLLAKPAAPGETVDMKLCKSAKPYLSIAFSNIESFKVFSEFVAEFYQLAQEAKNELSKQILQRQGGRVEKKTTCESLRECALSM